MNRKVRIYPEGYKIPEIQRITFSPKTFLITPENQNLRLVFKGMDFINTQFDSVLINDLPLIISMRTKDSMLTYIPKFITGTFDVHLFHKGFKFTLHEKLVIKNNLFNLDLNNLRNFTFELNSFPVKLFERYSEWFMGRGYTDTTYSDKNLNMKPDQPIIINNIETTLNGFTLIYNHYSIFSSLKLIFSKNWNIIELLEYNQSESGENNGGLFNYSTKIILRNVPYQITEHNFKKSLEINISGIEINNHYPLIQSDYIFSTGNNTRITITKSYVTKKEPINDYLINLYPATDSSSIKFEIY